MPGILITQCVQNDFVRPLAAGEPLPNLVHVGALEADRLCGPAGALVSFLRTAHAIDPGRLCIIHIVDRHDPQKHAAHLAQFRTHCLAGSEGARLVDPIEGLAEARADTRLITGGNLNDFEDSALAEALAEATAGDTADPIRIGVVGVWTDAKVAFLAYDLRTRFRASRLATCSALTASRSLDAHFRGLESLNSLLEVEVFHSPGAFLDWLVPGRKTTAPVPAATTLSFSRPTAIPRGWTAETVAERDALLSQLAGVDGRLELTPLGGGFSGAQVFIARGAESNAHVLKLGARDELARERFGNERVGRVLGDVVPRLMAWREGDHLGGMKMELAESDDPTVSPATFKSVYEADDSERTTDLLVACLEDVLDRALGRLYRTAQKDNGDLLELYGFTDRQGRPQFGDFVVARAEEVTRGNGFASTAALLRDAGLATPWMEPAGFYGDWLPGHSLTREIYPSLVHGDLNLANILLSRRPDALRPARVWVIDFARLTRLPSLTDFAKVENDLAYILLPVADDADMARARRMQEARLASLGLEVDLAAFATTPAERRHARLITSLRAIAARIDPRGPAAMADYRVALFRYAAHTIGFDEPNLKQRRLALEACARLAGIIAAPSVLGRSAGAATAGS